MTTISKIIVLVLLIGTSMVSSTLFGVPAANGAKKWCGQADGAFGGQAFGNIPKTTQCCNWHDTCGYIVHKGETFHSITNHGYANIYECRCDRDFYKCLQDAGEPVAALVSALHFNVVRAPCGFMKDGQLTLSEWSEREKHESLYSLVLHKENHKKWMHDNAGSLLPKELGVKAEEMWETLMAWMDFRFRTE